MIFHVLKRRRTSAAAIFYAHLALVMSPISAFAQDNIDGVYSGQASGSPAGFCNDGTIVVSVNKGFVYDSHGINRGVIAVGSQMTWQSETASKHIPTSVSATMSGNGIKIQIVSRGHPICTRTATLIRKLNGSREANCKSYNRNYDGATGSRLIVGLDGKPICSEREFSKPNY